MEVDVAPFERERFADSDTRPCHREEQRVEAPCVLPRRVEEGAELVAIERLPLDHPLAAPLSSHELEVLAELRGRVHLDDFVLDGGVQHRLPAAR